MNRNLLRKISRAIRYRKIEALVRRRLWKFDRRRVYRKEIEAALKKPLPPVLVYQMAKVASMSVAEALRNRNDLSVFHVHLIDPDNIEQFSRALRKKNLHRDSTDLDDYGRVIHERLIKPGHKAKIITLVREPVSRNISAYFHILDILWQTPDAYRNIALERLLEDFPTMHNYLTPLHWFDHEFRAVTGIDIYDHPFPHDTGFLRLSTERYEVLIMRHDLNDRLKEQCIRELIGVEDISIVPTNIGADKVYAATYKRFLEAIRLPESYVSEMLDSKYTRHFYTADEIERFRAKWLRHTPPITTIKRWTTCITRTHSL